MLGDNNQYHFHKGVLMFDSGWTSSNVSNGLLKLNGSIVPTTGTNFPSNLSILTLRTAGNVEASNFSNDRNIGGRYANGDLGELLIFTHLLFQMERLKKLRVTLLTNGDWMEIFRVTIVTKLVLMILIPLVFLCMCAQG